MELMRLTKSLGRNFLIIISGSQISQVRRKVKAKDTCGKDILVKQANMVTSEMIQGENLIKGFW